MPTPIATLVPRTTSSHAGKYLTVILENEACGIAFSKVREIVRVQRITPSPQASRHVKGIIELRGRVIPIVDLREKFGLKAEFAERMWIVVVEARLPAGQSAQTGLIVDSVEETVTPAAGEIERAPDFGAKIHPEYMLGTAHIRGRSKTLLDLERVVSPEGIDAMAEAV